MINFCFYLIRHLQYISGTLWIFIYAYHNKYHVWDVSQTNLSDRGFSLSLHDICDEKGISYMPDLRYSTLLTGHWTDTCLTWWFLWVCVCLPNNWKTINRQSCSNSASNYLPFYRIITNFSLFSLCLSLAKHA